VEKSTKPKRLIRHRETAEAIDIDRCLRDFPYYAEKLLRIVPKKGSIIPLQLNSMQELLWHGKGAIPDFDTNPRYKHVRVGIGWKEKLARGEPIREVILKYRQAGMSTIAMAFLFWRTANASGRNAMVIAHEEKATKHLFGMADRFYDYLPPEFRPKVQNRTQSELIFGRTKKNVSEEERGVGLNSSIYTATAGDKGAGHGRTLQFIILSELARWPEVNMEAVMTGLNEAMPSGMDAAGTMMIIESVADAAGDLFHHYYNEAVEGQSEYEPIFLPWHLHNEYRQPKPSHLVFPDEFLEFQEEYNLTEEELTWYYFKYRNLEVQHPGRGLKVMRAMYPSNEQEAFSGTGFCAFDEDSLLECKEDVMTPIARYTVDRSGLYQNADGPLQIWEEPKENSVYAVGVDVSLGVGQTDSVIEVLKHPGYQQVAEWRSAKIDPKELAYITSRIGQFYNHALVAVEINNAGVLTNSELEEIYPSGNLYVWEKFNQRTQTKTQQLGWQTTLETKSLLVGHVRSLLRPKEVDVIIRSHGLLDQLLTFNDFNDGRYGAAANCRDDLVMAWLIACMAMWRKIARHDLSVLDSPEDSKPNRDREDLYYDDWRPGQGEHNREWMK
jgi:hypothetical protein